MHRILSLFVLILFLIEEMFHQRLGKAGRLPSRPVDYDTIKNNFDRFDLLRILELLLIGLLFSTATGSAATGRGQLALILVGLQVARLFGRRVLSRWAVLGIVQGLEALLLLSIILVPVKTLTAEYPLSPLPALAIIGGGIYGIFVFVSVAFSISYATRLLSRESSSLYDTFPPLVDSENWAYRFSRFSLFFGVTGVAGMFDLGGFSLLPILFSVSLILQFTGTQICRKETFNGHHPVSHILWGISFLILYFLTVSGISTIGYEL